MVVLCIEPRGLTWKFWWDHPKSHGLWTMIMLTLGRVHDLGHGRTVLTFGFGIAALDSLPVPVLKDLLLSYITVLVIDILLLSESFSALFKWYCFFVSTNKVLTNLNTVIITDPLRLKHSGCLILNTLTIAGGVLITYIFLLILIVHLNVAMHKATAVCSILGIVLSLGLAFWPSAR